MTTRRKTADDEPDNDAVHTRINSAQLVDFLGPTRRAEALPAGGWLLVSRRPYRWQATSVDGAVNFVASGKGFV